MKSNINPNIFIPLSNTHEYVFRSRLKAFTEQERKKIVNTLELRYLLMENDYKTKITDKL